MLRMNIFRFSRGLSKLNTDRSHAGQTVTRSLPSHTWLTYWIKTMQTRSKCVDKYGPKYVQKRACKKWIIARETSYRTNCHLWLLLVILWTWLTILFEIHIIILLFWVVRTIRIYYTQIIFRCLYSTFYCCFLTIKYC